MELDEASSAPYNMRSRSMSGARVPWLSCCPPGPCGSGSVLGQL